MEYWLVPLVVLSAIEMVGIGWLVNKVRTLRRNYSEAVAPVIQYIPVPSEPEVPMPQPDRPYHTPLSDSDRYFLERLKKTIFEEMAHGKVEVETLASRMCISRSQLNRRVHALTGMSTSNYSIQLRLDNACLLLRDEPELSVSVIALRSGFDDAAYFARIFRRKIGQAPTTYRKSIREPNTEDHGTEESN